MDFRLMLQGFTIAVVSALFSGSLTGFIAVLKMKDSITELGTLVKSTVEFRLSSLEARVANLEEKK